MTQDNKALVMRLFDEVFTNRNPDAADEIMAEEYLEHAVEPFGERNRAWFTALRTPGRWSYGSRPSFRTSR